MKPRFSFHTFLHPANVRPTKYMYILVLPNVEISTMCYCKGVSYKRNTGIKGSYMQGMFISNQSISDSSQQAPSPPPRCLNVYIWLQFPASLLKLTAVLNICSTCRPAKLLVYHFKAVLIISCIINAEDLLHMQCYRAAKLQHLIVAECYISSFSADFIHIVIYTL